MTKYKMKISFVALVLLFGSVACTEDPSQTDSSQTNQAESDVGDELDAVQEADSSEGSDIGGDSDVEEEADADEESDIIEEPDTNEEYLAGGDTCEDAIDVTAGGVWENQSLDDMSDQYDSVIGSGCPAPSTSGADRVFFVAPQEDRSYQVRVEPIDDSYDALVYVRDDCDATECITGANLNSSGGAEVVIFDAAKGQPTWIIADSVFLEEGDFDLIVTILD